jgi:hypothetical protein
MSAIRSIAGGLAVALLSACAGKPAPAPQAAAPPPPVLAEPPPAESVAGDWRDRALTPGDWSFDPGAGEARFGDFSLRCDSGRRRIVMARSGASGPLRLRTTFGERTLPSGAALPATDPLLDELAFSRGRFTVDSAGATTLVLPAWPESARVIEDCRG